MRRNNPLKLNPRGRTKFDKCVEGVSRSGSAADPRRVCGAVRARGGLRDNVTRSNPVDGAEARYESFHGTPSTEMVEVVTPIHEHHVLSGMGELKKLVIQAPNGYLVAIKKFDGAILSQNEAATQLFIEGGDQSVNLDDFGIKGPYHEKEVLGVCVRVHYFTTKKHLRPEDGGTAVYDHKFGKNKPTIIYDVPNGLIEFAGGGYTIPDEGIDG